MGNRGELQRHKQPTDMVVRHSTGSVTPYAVAMGAIAVAALAVVLMTVVAVAAIVAVVAVVAMANGYGKRR